MTSFSPTADIAICGAGPVGLALAALLVRRGMAAGRVLLLDSRALAAACTDPRSIALSYGSSLLLQEIGAWPIAARAIRQIHVSRRGQFGRTLIDSAQYGLPALGYVTRYGVLVEALSRATAALGIDSRRPASVTTMTEQAHAVELHLASGESLTTGLLVQAEGGVFGTQAVRARSHDYAQTAIVAQVRVSKPLPQRAFERFTDEGPLALLPQAEDRGVDAQQSHAGYGLVWCMRPQTASDLMALSEDAFLRALQEAFGTRLGRFVDVSARNTFSLGLNADPAATQRTVAIGNAAQTLHPVAGQGLNLGLRDAAVLARLLAQDRTPPVLQRFISERQRDRKVTIGMTDSMARLFASAPEGTMSQMVLGLSLGALDACAPARRVLAEQMMYGQR